MKYRHWLLVVAAMAILYVLVFVRYVDWFVHYGENDIKAATWFAIAMVFAWVVLESVHHVSSGRRGVCGCGYSLKGIKCPECGRDLGGGAGG